jgi:lycopene cyclase domain-containing protein
MTYFGFIGIFLAIPIAILLLINWLDRRSGRLLPPAMRAFPPAAAIVLHAVIALLYTTIWDNYLVATRVWWYDPAKVTGITLGWVPIEEYTFFVVQPIMAGLWLLFVFRRVSLPGTNGLRATLRWWSTGLMAVIWLISVAILASGWQHGIYLGLILIWAVPPIALQLAFGADILWRYRRAVGLTFIPLTLYLGAADALAIFDGIWEISLA